MEIPLARETVEQLEELLEILIHVADGTQEDVDILMDVREVLGPDAVNILPHLKLALHGEA